MTDVGSIVENLLNELTSEAMFAADLESHHQAGQLLNYSEGRMNGLISALIPLGATSGAVSACYDGRPRPESALTVAQNALWSCLPDTYDIHDRALLACWLSDVVLPALYKQGYLRAIPSADGSIE
jgi:hypothetical protein